ncbi:chromate efflux transporter [Limoniibacter endophyticus]|uniref:Chromate transporter n=1 Tax=Limoniibacter endophyticus TaxID=1565040 RepID=A0A8J3DKP9_9HYPH|nr:chromate efflux transporter [Limoniibacter endophyticus]GHC77735.1 chromate transporter [Limoniibacter endophyticus]
MTVIDKDDRKAISSFGEIFWIFLKLGLTCFGGPVAHIGYFREEFVVRRKWLTDGDYADLVALSQFLPGPASSKVGFTLGLIRGGGLGGGLAAWLGFTLPSAIILFAAAMSAGSLSGPTAEAVIHGLKLVAVVVVAHAVFGMMRSLTPDRTRLAIGLAALAIVILFAGAWAQILAIFAGLLAGMFLCRETNEPVAADYLHDLVPIRAGAIALTLFGLLFLVPVAVAGMAADLFSVFYRAGALVFGGGHVLLPLLESELVSPGLVTVERFLAGYGITQAMPGPLFTFAAWLGAVSNTQLVPAVAAGIALVAVFLPGMLLAYGVLPFWASLRRSKLMRSAMRGGNAAVVGILAGALYDPVWTSSVISPLDFLTVAIGLALLASWRVSPLMVVFLVTGFATFSRLLA